MPPRQRVSLLVLLLLGAATVFLSFAASPISAQCTYTPPEEFIVCECRISGTTIFFEHQDSFRNGELRPLKVTFLTSGCKLLVRNATIKPPLYIESVSAIPGMDNTIENIEVSNLTCSSFSSSLRPYCVDVQAKLYLTTRLVLHAIQWHVALQPPLLWGSGHGGLVLLNKGIESPSMQVFEFTDNSLVFYLPPGRNFTYDDDLGRTGLAAYGLDMRAAVDITATGTIIIKNSHVTLLGPYSHVDENGDAVQPPGDDKPQIGLIYNVPVSVAAFFDHVGSQPAVLSLNVADCSARSLSPYFEQRAQYHIVSVLRFSKNATFSFFVASSSFAEIQDATVALPPPWVHIETGLTRPSLQTIFDVSAANFFYYFHATSGAWGSLNGESLRVNFTGNGTRQRQQFSSFRDAVQRGEAASWEREPAPVIVRAAVVTFSYHQVALMPSYLQAPLFVTTNYASFSAFRVDVSAIVAGGSLDPFDTFDIHSLYANAVDFQHRSTGKSFLSTNGGVVCNRAAVSVSNIIGDNKAEIGALFFGGTFDTKFSVTILLTKVTVEGCYFARTENIYAAQFTNGVFVRGSVQEFLVSRNDVKIVRRAWPQTSKLGAGITQLTYHLFALSGGGGAFTVPVESAFDSFGSKNNILSVDIYNDTDTYASIIAVALWGPAKYSGKVEIHNNEVTSANALQAANTGADDAVLPVVAVVSLSGGNQVFDDGALTAFSVEGCTIAVARAVDLFATYIIMIRSVVSGDKMIMSVLDNTVSGTISSSRATQLSAGILHATKSVSCFNMLVQGNSAKYLKIAALTYSTLNFVVFANRLTARAVTFSNNEVSTNSAIRTVGPSENSASRFCFFVVYEWDVPTGAIILEHNTVGSTAAIYSHRGTAYITIFGTCSKRHYPDENLAPAKCEFTGRSLIQAVGNVVLLKIHGGTVDVEQPPIMPAAAVEFIFLNLEHLRRRPAGSTPSVFKDSSPRYFSTNDNITLEEDYDTIVAVAEQTPRSSTEWNSEFGVCVQQQRVQLVFGGNPGMGFFTDTMFFVFYSVNPEEYPGQHKDPPNTKPEGFLLRNNTVEAKSGNGARTFNYTHLFTRSFMQQPRFSSGTWAVPMRLGAVVFLRENVLITTKAEWDSTHLLFASDPVERTCSIVASMMIAVESVRFAVSLSGSSGATTHLVALSHLPSNGISPSLQFVDGNLQVVVSNTSLEIQRCIGFRVSQVSLLLVGNTAPGRYWFTLDRLWTRRFLVRDSRIFTTARSIGVYYVAASIFVARGDVPSIMRAERNNITDFRFACDERSSPPTSELTIMNFAPTAFVCEHQPVPQSKVSPVQALLLLRVADNNISNVVTELPLRVEVLRFTGACRTPGGPNVEVIGNALEHLSVQRNNCAIDSAGIQLALVNFQPAVPLHSVGWWDPEDFFTVVPHNRRCIFNIYDNLVSPDASSCSASQCAVCTFARKIEVAASFAMRHNTLLGFPDVRDENNAPSASQRGSLSIINAAPRSFGALMTTFRIISNTMRGDNGCVIANDYTEVDGGMNLDVNYSTFVFRCNNFKEAGPFASVAAFSGAARNLLAAVDAPCLSRSMTAKVSRSRTLARTPPPTLTRSLTERPTPPPSLSDTMPSPTQTERGTPSALASGTLLANSSSATHEATSTRPPTRTQTSSRSRRTPSQSPTLAETLSPAALSHSATFSDRTRTPTAIVPLPPLPDAFVPTAAASATAIAALAAGAPAGAVFVQNMKMLGAVSRCGDNDDLSRLPPLGFDANPFRLEISESHVKEYRGALVGNSFLILGCLVVQYVAAFVLVRAGRHVSMESALREVRYPGLCIIPLLVFVGPTSAAFSTVFGAAILAQSGEIPFHAEAARFKTDIVMSLLFGAAMYCIGPLVVLIYVAQQCQKGEVLEPVKPLKLTTVSNLFTRLWLYLSHPWKAWKESLFSQKYGDAYEPYGAVSMMVGDYILPITLGLTGGAVLQLQKKHQCFIAAIICVVVTTIHLLALAVIRPFLNRLDTAVGFVASVFELFGAVIALLSVLGLDAPMADVGIFTVIVALIAAAAAMLPKMIRVFRSAMRVLRRVRASRKKAALRQKDKKKLRSNLREAMLLSSSSSGGGVGHDDGDGDEELLGGSKKRSKDKKKSSGAAAAAEDSKSKKKPSRAESASAPSAAAVRVRPNRNVQQLALNDDDDDDGDAVQLLPVRKQPATNSKPTRSTSSRQRQQAGAAPAAAAAASSPTTKPTRASASSKRKHQHVEI